MSRKPKTINPAEIDPSVYYYDEDYDDMKNEEKSSNQFNDDPKAGTKQGPKYIQGLIETANERKSDKEVRKFKKYARDREDAEIHGDLDESEIFITSAYKRKLDEIKKIDVDKRSRLKGEEARELNFTKVPTRPNENEDKTKHRFESSERESHRTDREQVPKSEQSREIDIPKGDARVRRSRTVEERREYLRELLKKRTVGKNFESALERYNQRKEAKQCST